MKNNRFRYVLITIMIFVIFCTCLFAEVQKIRYKRYVEEPDVFTYFTIAGEYGITNDILLGQVGFIVDFKISSPILFTFEGLAVTNDFSTFSFNMGGLLNIEFTEEDTKPFFGAGMILNLPTSKTLSTELVVKGNIGLIFSRSIRLAVYYTTPMDYIFDYHTVGVSVGIVI